MLTLRYDAAHAMALPTRDRLHYLARKGITLAAVLWSGRYAETRQGVYTFRIPSGPNKGHLFSTKNPEQSYAIGRYEWAVSNAVASFAKSGAVFYDVGANVGWHTLVASPRLGKDGHVFSFEPNVDSKQLLTRNVESNRLANVSIISKGVGARTGVQRFASYANCGLVNHVITPDAPAASDAVIEEISIVSIDDFGRAGNPPPNLVKIDAEGYELQVLEGACDTFAAHHPTVICEVRSGNWGSIEALMKSFGYSHRALGGNWRGLDVHGLDDMIFTYAD